ncbi:hypothetical protein FIBSPDRAFT_1039516 [Athelia psychrophila]|uniref:NYN domain-containing protein n=1 Tax=Athelia psychrophila TaxID=1759441 RepID=A0A166RKJ6_9AGAM|nr:hypothetical protein FIBSPDRAFT_1039516 [Fibularhizoctonia sp. CBS 109695]
MDCSQGTSKGNMIAVDMFAFAMRTPHPATLIVISDAQILGYAVSILRLRMYRVIVVGSAEGGRGSLKQRASEFMDWDVLVGQRRDCALLDALEGRKATQGDVGDDEDSRDGVLGHAPSVDDEQPREASAEATFLRPSTPQDEAIEAKAHPTLIEEVSLEEHPPHSPLSIHHPQLSQQSSPASNTIPLDLIPEMQSKPMVEGFQPTSSPTPEALAAELLRYRKLVEKLSSLPNPSRKRVDVIEKLLHCSTFLHTRESLGFSGLDGYAAQGIIDLGERVNADGTMTAWVCLGPSTGAPKGATTEMVSPNASPVHIPTINPVVTPASLFKMAGAQGGIKVGSLAPTTPEDASIVFRGLVDILRPHALLERSHVADMLLSYIKRDWPTFSRLGISGPDRLFALAASEGLVVFSKTPGWKKTKGKKWIALAPGWQNSKGGTQNTDPNVPLSFGNETTSQSSEQAAVIAQAKAISSSERNFAMTQLVSQGVLSSAIADGVCRPITSVPSLDVPGLSHVTARFPSVGLLVSEQSESETLSDVIFTPLVVPAPIGSSHEATTTYSPHLPGGDGLGRPEGRVRGFPSPMTGVLPCASPMNDAGLSPIFHALVDILRPHGRLARTEVAGILRIYIRQDKPAFSRRGIKKPSDLFALAASEGVVVLSKTIVYGRPEPCIALAPAWQTLTECTSIPEVGVSVSLDNKATAPDEQRNDNSHAAILDYAAENAGNSVHEPIITNTQGVSSVNTQANGSAKQEKEESIIVGVVDSTPPPNTSMINSLLAKLIGLVQKHGPNAESSIIAPWLKIHLSSYIIPNTSGVHSFKALINLAVATGLVTLGQGRDRTGKKIETISLAPDWQRRHPATSSALFPARTADVPLCTSPANDTAQSQNPEQPNDDSCGAATAILGRNPENAVLHDLVVSNVSGVHSQTNRSAKQEKEESVVVGVVDHIPPSTLIVDKALFAGLIGLIKKHGPEAKRHVVASGMKASNPYIFAKAGVYSFKEFVNLAVDEGLVTLGHVGSGRKQTDTISLS